VGGTAFLAWVALLWVAVARADRVAAAVAGGWDDRLALLALAAGLAGVWVWSWRDVGGGTGSAGRGAGRWRRAGRAFARNRTAAAGLVVVVALYAVALLAPFLAPFDPGLQGDLLRDRLLPPSPAHPLGTDQYARDVLSRLLYGARISLSIGLVAVGISASIGTVAGAAAGYLGGRVDALLMRLVDLVLSFPRLVLLISLIAVFQPGILVVVAVLGLTLWPGTARLVRGEVLSLRERAFVEAARALGYSRRRIVLRHLVPNALAPVVVAATLGIGNTIVLEAGLSFLGLGVQPPTPSWGTLVADGRDHLLGAWWLATFPGLTIVLAVLAFNLVGDGLRDALDPRMRGGGGAM
jgi:peptide/nickel transport system permease protein